MRDVIYLDNNASTAPDPEVVEAVAGAMNALVGNPSSHHIAGQAASDAIDAARAAVAVLVGSRPADVVFTSGATEANNLALVGLWDATRLTQSLRTRVVLGATEHPSVLEVAALLEARGAEVVLCPVDQGGVLDLDQLAQALNESTLVASVMMANNETGVISPLSEVVAMARRVGAFVHSDATQAIGRVPVSFSGLQLDLMSFSGHKMHGPKGVGGLIVHRHVPLFGMVRGGGQERGLRLGTLNTPGIVGLGVAARLSCERLPEAERIGDLRDRFVRNVQTVISGVQQNGSGSPRLPNTANLRFVGADAEAVMAGMPAVICSSGSACSSAVPTPSPVLLAMGLSSDAAGESLRFSLSRNTSEAELSRAVPLIARAVAHVRAMTGEVCNE